MVSGRACLAPTRPTTACSGRGEASLARRGSPPRRAMPVNIRAMVRSYVHEARKRVGQKRERIRPVVERLAREHEAVIALRFRDDLELLVSVIFFSKQKTAYEI